MTKYTPSGTAVPAPSTEPAYEGRRIPQVGEQYRSRDPRDDGLIVTVLDYANGFVRIQRFRKTNVSLRRFYRDYERVESAC